jgi:hypothetical protein
MLGFSLNPIDWVKDAVGWAVDTTSGAILDAITAWVEDGLRSLAQSVASMVTELGALDTTDGGFLAVSSMFRFVAVATVIGTMMVSVGFAVGSRRVELGDVVHEIPRTLVMMAGWSAVCAIWFQVCQALTRWALADTLESAFQSGLQLDSGIGSFLRMFIALVMFIALLVFAVELLFIGFLAPFAVALGPVSIALRPWPDLRIVSRRMVMNVAVLSLTPFLVAASMSMAMRQLTTSGVLDFGLALRGMAGMMVSVLMPAMVKKYLPLDGDGGAPGRAMLAAAAAITAAAAGAGMMASGAGGAAGAGGSGGGQMAALSGPPPGGGGGGSGGSGSGSGSGAVPLAPTRSPSSSTTPSGNTPSSPPPSPSGPATPSTGPSGGGQLAALATAAQAAEVLGDER